MVALSMHADPQYVAGMVLRLISEDRTTPQIARQLKLSENTVHTHRPHISTRTWAMNERQF